MESESDVRDKHLDDIVISGISCRLPESDNMQEFRDNLMNGVDMVTDDDRRWKSGKAWVSHHYFSQLLLQRETTVVIS